MKMRPIAFILFFAILITVSSCGKDEAQEPKDVIVFEEINKTIISSGIDSISGTCRDLLFEMEVDDQMQNLVSLNTDTSQLCCDGFNSILADPLSSKVLVLDNETLISSSASWVDVRQLSLDDFAGKGEMYVGYRACFYPEGTYNYRFAWIKIRVSPNNDTLTIISRADNKTNNKSIYSGQVE